MQYVKTSFQALRSVFDSIQATAGANNNSENIKQPIRSIEQSLEIIERPWRPREVIEHPGTMIEHFTRLPRELRNDVYSHLWGQAEDLPKVPSLDGEGPIEVVRFPWPALGPVFAREAVEWAYENYDANELIQMFNPWRQNILDYMSLPQWMRKGIFDVDIAPRDVFLPRLTVHLYCRIHGKFCNLKPSRYIKTKLNSVLEAKHFKQGFQLNLVVFIYVEDEIMVGPHEYLCKELKPIVEKFENKGISVNVEVHWRKSLDEPVFRWPVSRDMLGSSEDEWRLHLRAMANEWGSQLGETPLGIGYRWSGYVCYLEF